MQVTQVQNLRLIGNALVIICSCYLLVICTTGVILPISCGVHLTPDGGFLNVNIHCEGDERKVVVDCL
jgi:hypothetical protein